MSSLSSAWHAICVVASVAATKIIIIIMTSRMGEARHGNELGSLRVLIRTRVNVTVMVPVATTRTIWSGKKSIVVCFKMHILFCVLLDTSLV